MAGLIDARPGSPTLQAGPDHADRLDFPAEETGLEASLELARLDQRLAGQVLQGGQVQGAVRGKGRHPGDHRQVAQIAQGPCPTRFGGQPAQDAALFRQRADRGRLDGPQHVTQDEQVEDRQHDEANDQPPWLTGEGDKCQQPHQQQAGRQQFLSVDGEPLPFQRQTRRVQALSDQSRAGQSGSPGTCELPTCIRQA